MSTEKKTRPSKKAIRQFILDNIEKHPKDLSKITSTKFNISRQAINIHLKKLVEEKIITEIGKTKNKSYQLNVLMDWNKNYQINKELAEDLVWSSDIVKLLGQMPENVANIWHYGFTEMLNNVIDHSEGTEVSVRIIKNILQTEILISDNGIGIFKKIQTKLGLLDERHAVLELSKGKLTTDPEHHSGEGIFFSIQMFDKFGILSGNSFFSHRFGDQEYWMTENEEFQTGTVIWMKLKNETSRTMKEVFDKFALKDCYGFDKTVVPVKLAQYGNDMLISRSQAKRLLSRIEKFKIVMFDFKGVEEIGQAFADEIFRVFAKKHPGVELYAIHASFKVKQMIDRAKIAKEETRENS